MAGPSSAAGASQVSMEEVPGGCVLPSCSRPRLQRSEALSRDSIARRSRTPSLLQSPGRAGSIGGLLGEQEGELVGLEGAHGPARLLHLLRGPSLTLPLFLLPQNAASRARRRRTRPSPGARRPPSSSRVCARPSRSSSSRTPAASRSSASSSSSPTSCQSATRTRGRRRRRSTTCSASRPRVSSRSTSLRRTARCVASLLSSPSLSEYH